MIVKGRNLNWKPSRPQKFALKYRALRESGFADRIDLRPNAAPIKDQGQFGACSGFSSSVCTEFLELAELRKVMPIGQAPQEYIAGQFAPVSPMFIYNNERLMEGTPLEQDAGATTLGDACKSLTNQGVCRESTFPYTAENLVVVPPQGAYNEAKAHRVPVTYALDADAVDLMTCLSAGFPFLFGIVVYNSFMSDASAATGVIPVPHAADSVVGGHALACVGYIRDQAWIFQNSWGTGWGDKGFGYLPWDYMTDADLADDHFTLRY